VTRDFRYAAVEVIGPQGRAGVKALHAFCTGLLQLLAAQRHQVKVQQQPPPQQQPQQEQHQQEQQPPPQSQQQQHQQQQQPVPESPSIVDDAPSPSPPAAQNSGEDGREEGGEGGQGVHIQEEVNGGADGPASP